MYVQFQNRVFRVFPFQVDLLVVLGKVGLKGVETGLGKIRERVGEFEVVVSQSALNHFFAGVANHVLLHFECVVAEI